MTGVTLPRSVSAALLVAAATVLAVSPAAASEDFRDIGYVSAVVNKVLEYDRNGTTVPWTNPETGNSGEITVETTYFLDPDTPCRSYRRSTMGTDGKRVEVKGSGCRTPRGVWRLNETADEETAEAPPETPPAEPAPASPAVAATTAAPAERAGPSDPAAPAAGTEGVSADETAGEEEKPEPIFLSRATLGDEPLLDEGEGDRATESRATPRSRIGWTAPVPRPKPQLAVILTSTPTQSDE